MKRQYTTIFVNPVQRTSAQGRHQQVYTVRADSGELVASQQMHKTREIGTGATLQFQFNPETNRYETGLDTMVTSPLKGRSVEDVMQEFGLSQSWQHLLGKLVEQDKILKQTLFEISDATEPGYYTSEAKTGNLLSRNLKDTAPPTFIQTFKFILYDRPNRITDETPRGRVAIQLMKINQKVANSLNIVNSAIHDWYISEENEAELEKAKKRDIIETAIYHIQNIKREQAPFVAYQTAILCKDKNGDPIVKGEVSDLTVKNALSGFVSDDNPAQMDNIEKFEVIFELLQTREGLDRFSIMYLIQQAINTNVISMRDGYYIWNSKISSGENVSKFTDHDKLVSFLLKEKSVYDEDNKEVTNWYGELLNEVKLKNIRFE